MLGLAIGSGDFSWPFWLTVPIYPCGRRRTIRQEVVKDAVWTFDQLQGIFYVVVPIRMTVVKLEEGGLLVYAPVAPTPECVRLVEELVREHGEIKYIILPTISGLEHKVFVNPFARRFPKAQVFVAPSQWSFPLNLPLSWLGLPRKRTQVIPEDSSFALFGEQLSYAVPGPIAKGLGLFAEVAFFDKRSRTLLVISCLGASIVFLADRKNLQSFSQSANLLPVASPASRASKPEAVGHDMSRTFGF